MESSKYCGRRGGKKRSYCWNSSYTDDGKWREIGSNKELIHLHNAEEKEDQKLERKTEEVLIILENNEQTIALSSWRKLKSWYQGVSRKKEDGFLAKSLHVPIHVPIVRTK